MPRGSAADAQRILRSTGSFSGFRATIKELGNGYLTAEKKFRQPLCGNKEGWGPLSRWQFSLNVPYSEQTS
jgi:hypothetical protein